jgi:hypothetical protein
MQHVHALPGVSGGEIPGGCTLSVCHEEWGYAFCVRGDGGELLLLAGEAFEEGRDGTNGKDGRARESVAGNPFLSRRDYKRVFVAACYREKMLVPERFYREEVLSLPWMLHGDCTGDDRLLCYRVKEWDARVVGALPASVEQLYRELQPECTFLPGGAPLARMAVRTCARDREYIFADVRDDHVDLLLVRDRQPLLFNAFYHETESDIFYSMLHAARSCQFNERHARLVLTGRVAPGGKLHELLARYWTSPLLVTEPALNALARDTTMNTTPFVHLLNLHACES